MPDTLLDQDVLDAIAAAKQPAIQEVDIDGRPTPITKPFASPADWRDHWIYFLMVDRFNNPDGPPRDPWDSISTRFQGGTFEGIRRQLPYLKRLGVGAIWLTPMLQNPPSQEGSFHGYGIQHFLKIHPRYATPGADPEAELQALIDEAHARGIYVIFDIVLNHAGNVFAYVLNDGTVVDETDWSDTDYKVRWRGADGVPRTDWEDAPPDGAPGLTPDAAVWPSEIRQNEYFRKKGRGGVLGGDFASLKELITGNEAVRNALIRIYQWVMARFDIDGYRIDTLMYVEQDFARIFGNAMREFAQQIGKKNFFTFGEVYDSEEMIAHFIGRYALDSNDRTGIDAALDFPVYYKLPGISKGVTRPSDLVGVFEHRKVVQRGIISSHSEASRYFVTFCDNHDMKERIRYVDPADPSRYDHQVAMAVGCLFALQGIPCLYYGTEQGLLGTRQQRCRCTGGVVGQTQRIRR